MIPIGNRPILWHIMKIYAAHGHREVLYMGSDRAAIVDYLCESTRAGDLVLTLGAGDVGQLGGELLRRLDDDSGTPSKRR